MGTSPRTGLLTQPTQPEFFKPISTGALSFIVYLVSSFLHGTLEPRDIGTPSRSTGTLEPRDIRTPSAQGGERAPTREPGMGTDPRNGFLFSGTPLAVTGGLSAARFTAEPLMEVTTSWVTVVGLSFPETLRRGALL